VPELVVLVPLDAGEVVGPDIVVVPMVPEVPPSPPVPLESPQPADETPAAAINTRAGGDQRPLSLVKAIRIPSLARHEARVVPCPEAEL
jgi:hypothetical protein